MKDIMLLPRNHHHLHLSACLTGGGGKPPHAVELSTSSSSSASTLSTSSSSPCSVAATRKPRTPRKRPNQTYNEAAAILSASYPNLFDSPKCHAGSAIPFFLLPRAADDDHLLFSPPPTTTRCLLPRADYSDFPDFSRAAVTDPDSDFDAESLLDEDSSSADAGRGIDIIMGDLAAANDEEDFLTVVWPPPRPLGFTSAFRRDYFRGESANWWCFPAVDMLELSPRLNRNPPPPPPNTTAAKQKKTKKAKSAKVEIAAEEGIGGGGAGLSLNLNHEGVMRAWSGKGSAFSDEGLAGVSFNDDDIAARAAEIELFPVERGGVREESVLRYKEKRRTRLFSKKIIRYQVRKVNAERRPRLKGRFVRRPSSKHD